MSLSILDWQQVIKSCFDPTNDALRVTGANFAPETEPADGSINNNEVVFWKNGSDELIAKHKDSGGVVRSLTLGTLA